MQLHVDPHQGLVVIVPPGFRRHHLPEVIAGERAWIERALAWAREQRRSQVDAVPTRPPRQVRLPAVGECWQVEYRATGSRVTAAREHPGGRLRVTGDTDDAGACFAALRRWTARAARQRLVPRLEQLAVAEALPLAGTTVRNQRTRWASCSPAGIIGINRKLLFLPPHLVDYVFIHELCHLVHLDHSPRFWAELAARIPRYREHERELAEAWRLVPTWMQADGYQHRQDPGRGR